MYTPDWNNDLDDHLNEDKEYFEMEIEEESIEFTDEEIEEYGMDIINFMGENDLDRKYLVYGQGWDNFNLMLMLQIVVAKKKQFIYGNA